MWGLGSKPGVDVDGRGQLGGGGRVRQHLLLLKLVSKSEALWLHAEAICRDKGLGLGQMARRSGQGGS